MATNFALCAAANVPLSPQLVELYGYDGPIINIARNSSTQITLAGCKALCGDGADWYPWAKQAGTLTTWIFPALSLCLQAPFMSNVFWSTVFTLARWIGNPMATLSYLLWNIKVAGKCALLVDMSVPFDTDSRILADRDTDFASIRDSLYLLNVMNQYTMRPHVRQKKEAEGLLRMVLFSKDLRLVKEDAGAKLDEPMMRMLTGSGRVQATEQGGHQGRTSAPKAPELTLEPEGHLDDLRQRLAEDLRANRKRGVVPVYLSLLWFLFSLGISIQSAFGLLGLNSEAHDLAMGCVLSWLPVLVLCSIVDRNPVNPEKIRKKLNKLVDRVRLSLMDERARGLYLETIRNPTQRSEMHRRAEGVAAECNTFEGFFIDFAGQGRTRWHYGCAHPIIKDIERAYVAAKGRDWLAFEQEARTLLVLGDISGGLDWLDYRELWQVSAAVTTVGGTVFGAFCLSFFTPTVGLGCRSRGYVVFALMSLGLLLAEMVAWWVMDARKEKLARWYERQRQSGRRNAINHRRDESDVHGARPRHSFLQNLLDVWTAAEQKAVATQRDKLPQSFQRKLRAAVDEWRARSAPRKLELTILRPLEVVNAIWLIYIVCAQTFGAYNTCECKTQGLGGHYYLDLGQTSTAHNQWVRLYWIGGTVVSVLTMGAALSYVVLQWCLQSHMSTLDRRKAARGLIRTRRFRLLTIPILWTYRLLPRAGNVGLRYLGKLLRRCGLPLNPSSSSTLRWTRDVTCGAEGAYAESQRGQPLTELPSRQRDSPVPGESVPLIVEPDFAHLPSTSRSRSWSSNDRSISPTTGSHQSDRLLPRQSNERSVSATERSSPRWNQDGASMV